MDKSKLKKTLNSKEVRDYTYAIMFFLVSAFFMFFVIRPVLTLAVSLRREADDLTKINKVYENNITRMLELQSQLEDIQPRKYLLSEALPVRPNISQVIADLSNAGVEAGVPISAIEVVPMELKTDKNVPPPPYVRVRLQASSGYAGIDSLLKAIMNQRRIKTVNVMDMGATQKGDEIFINLQIQLDAQFAGSG